MTHKLNKILAFIEYNKINTSKFLKDLKLEPTAIEDWKTVKSASYNKKLQAIALYLNIPINYLMNEDVIWSETLHEDFLSKSNFLEKSSYVEEHGIPSNFPDVAAFYYSTKSLYVKNNKLTEDEAELVNLYRESNVSTKKNITSIIKLLIKLDSESQNTILEYIQPFDTISHKLIAKGVEIKDDQPPFDEKTTL